MAVAVKNIQVHVISILTADTVWGPRPVRGGERVGWLRKRIATSLECGIEDVLKLFQGVRQLEDDESLASLLFFTEEELELSVLRPVVGVKEMLQRMEEFHRPHWDIRVSRSHKDIKVAEEDVAARLHEIAALCDCEELPIEVGNFLEVLMTAGKVLKRDWVDSSGVCRDQWSAPSFGADANHQPGLLCLSAKWHRPDVWPTEGRFVYLVDLTGALSEMYGAVQNGSGSIWLGQWTGPWLVAEGGCEREVTTAFGVSAVPTLEMIRRMKDGEMPIPGTGEDMPMMSCVAPSLFGFLREMSSSGRVPAGAQDDYRCWLSRRVDRAEVYRLRNELEPVRCG